MEDNKTEEKVYSNFEEKEIDKPKKKKVKNKRKSIIPTLVLLAICIGILIGYFYYNNHNTNKLRVEVDTFCNQFNMSKGDCGGISDLCCEVKLNDNLIQRVKIEKIDNKWMFIQEGLK
jgi:hypothetical protein